MLSRLKKTGRFMAVLVLLNVLTSYGFTSNDSPQVMRAIVTAQTPDAKRSNGVVSESGAKRRSVPPAGWRRTNRGWEDVSKWTTPTPSIESLMETQAAREPALARGLLAQLSRLSPVTFAMCQVVAILAIACLATLDPQKAHEETQTTAASDHPNDHSLDASSDD